MMRLPQGQFGPRRGFQVQSTGVGGLGSTSYTPPDGSIEKLCIGTDGLLYRQNETLLEITYTGSRYLTLSILVDTDVNPDSLGWSFVPWSLMPWGLPTNPRIISKAYLNNAAIADGDQSNTTTFNVDAGHALNNGDIIVFYDASGEYQERQITSTTATSITFTGFATSIHDNMGITLYRFIYFGKGYDEGVSYSINQFSSFLNAIPGVTSSVTGDGSYPAAFLDFMEPTNITDGNTLIKIGYYWSAVNRTTTVTFPGQAANQFTSEFEIASMVEYARVCYIATGYDDVYKYDGQTVYRSGMPQGMRPNLTQVSIGSGDIPNGTYVYWVTYEQVDNAGNIIEGVQSVTSSMTISAGPSNVDVIIQGIQPGSGFNTNCAVVDGAQTGVTTITVQNSPQTLKEGDTAFFIEESAAVANGAQSNVTTVVVNAPHTLNDGDEVFFFDSSDVRQFRTVTSTTATSITFADQDPVTVSNGIDFSCERTRRITTVTETSITIDGPAVNVVHAQPISNNLKINVYRTTNGGTIGRLVATLANNSLAATQTFQDSITDSGLGREYITPIRQPDLPPRCKYLLPYNNILIYAGGTDEEDAVYFSEPDNPEYVPAATNFFLVPPNQDDITGLGQSGSTLAIFKGQSIYAVSGDIINGQFSVQAVSPGYQIGCSSHASIKSIGGLLYFLYQTGVYSMTELTIFPTDQKGTPIPVSMDIDNLFRTQPLDESSRWVYKRAVAENFSTDNQYWLYMPCETTSGVPNQNSRVLVYDYQANNWFIWNNIDAAGGFIKIGSNIYWQGRNANGTPNFYRQLRYYRLIDQVDHIHEIDVQWKSSWEDVGEPYVRKKFIRCVMLLDRVSTLRQLNQPQLIFHSYVDRFFGTPSTVAETTVADNSTAWSFSSWSASPWAGRQDDFIRIPLKMGTVSKSMAIGIKLQQYYSTFLLQGYQLEIAPDFRRSILR